MDLLDMKPVFAIVCKVFQVIAKLRCVREAFVHGWTATQHRCSMLQAGFTPFVFSPCPAEIQICFVLMGKLGTHLRALLAGLCAA